MRLKVGEGTAQIFAQHNSLIQVVSAALGGGKSGEKREDISAGASSPEAAIAMINSALSFG